MKALLCTVTAASVFVALLTGCSAVPVAETPAVSASDDAAANAALQSQIVATRAEMKDLLERLRSVEDKLPPLPPAKYTIELTDSPSMGDPNAPIAIVEFSDFQCPYCRRFHETTMLYLKKEYLDTGKARLIFRDTPLSDIHPQAKPAAIAARCAHRQDKFWSYAAVLFAQQEELKAESYREIAQEQALDMDKFSVCLKDPAVQASVEADHAYAQIIGVEATPSFFVGLVQGNKVIDAIPLAGAVPFPYFAGAVDKLMRDAAAAPLASRE